MFSRYLGGVMIPLKEYRLRSKRNKQRTEIDPYMSVRSEVVADGDGVPLQLHFPFPAVEDDYPAGFDLDKAMKAIHRAQNRRGKA